MNAQEQTLGQLVERSEVYDQQKAEFKGTEYAFKINDNLDIEAQDKMGNPFGQIAPLRLTGHALTQLCERTGSVITASVAERLRANNGTRPHAARAFDELREQMERNPRRAAWWVRAYKDEARAVLTTAYASTPNTQLMRLAVEGIERLAAETGQAVDVLNFPGGRSSVTPDHLHLYAGLRDIKTNEGNAGDRYFKLGFTIRNSEIGDGGLKISPYVQRTSCTNSIVFAGQGDFYAVHRGSGQILMREVVVAVGNALKLSFSGLEMFLNARDVELPNVSAEIDKLAQQHGWSTEVVAAVGAGTEGSATLAGLVNGITFAAHTKFEDPQERMDMETLAGELLTRRMTEHNAR